MPRGVGAAAAVVPQLRSVDAGLAPGRWLCMPLGHPPLIEQVLG